MIKTKKKSEKNFSANSNFGKSVSLIHLGFACLLNYNICSNYGTRCDDLTLIGDIIRKSKYEISINN